MSFQQDHYRKRTSCVNTAMGPTRQISCALDTDIADQLEELAAKRRQSRNVLLRETIAKLILRGEP